MKAVTIASLGSGQGKTILTLALLHWFKTNGFKTRPFKVGPDYIDTQFHKNITGLDSINLDLYMSSEEELKQIFSYYTKDMDSIIIEGVMGYYDGIDYKTSTYDVAKTINVQTILIISAEGSYSTLIPVIQGIINYKNDNTVKGIILNKISSENHYQLIKNQINQALPQLSVLGWIKKELPALDSRHLGLDLKNIKSKNLDDLANSVLENINILELMNFMEYKMLFSTSDDFISNKYGQYADMLNQINLSIVYDEAFSFLYKANLTLFEKVFNKVNILSALNDDEIPTDTDIVYIPGGYVETPEIAYKLNKSNQFKKSLYTIAQNKNKNVYAECAGLMVLGNQIKTVNNDNINGVNILPVDFEMNKSYIRLGYYQAQDIDNLNIYKGHSFHYSKPVTAYPGLIDKWKLFKKSNTKNSIGAWTNSGKNVLGTYLHSFLFNQPEIIYNYFIPEQYKNVESKMYERI